MIEKAPEDTTEIWIAINPEYFHQQVVTFLNATITDNTLDELTQALLELESELQDENDPIIQNADWIDCHYLTH